MKIVPIFQRRLFAFFLTAVLLLSGGAVRGQSGGAPWKHFGGDDAFSGMNNAEHIISPENVSQLEQKWGVGCEDEMFSVISRAPALYNGMLFTAGAGNNLDAYDARTGDSLWEFGEAALGWAPQPAVSDDGIVFYMAGTETLYDVFAVDSESGTLVWQSPLQFDQGFNDSAQMTVDEANNLLYVVENPFMGGGKLFALDQDSGQVMWFMNEATTGYTFRGDYAILSGGKLLVMAEGDPFNVNHNYAQGILQIDIAAQQVEMAYDVATQGTATLNPAAAVCNGMVYGTYTSEYHEPGRTLAASAQGSAAVVWQKDYGLITGTVACSAALNRIYVPTESFLYALDATTGDELWKRPAFSPVYSPSIANGVVYYLSDTNMYAVDEATGDPLFSFRLGAQAYENTQVAISDGMVYFSGNGGTCDLFALGLPEGVGGESAARGQSSGKEEQPGK